VSKKPSRFSKQQQTPNEAGEVVEETGKAPRRPPRVASPIRNLTSNQVVDRLDEVRARTKIIRNSPAVQRWFRTGLTVLDCAINQGIPGGRVVELSGPEKSGKSTLAAMIVSEAQKQGGRGDYFDLESGTTVGQLTEMGHCSLDPSHFELWQPDTAEQAFQAIDEIIPIVGSSGFPSVIVLDSVPALISEVELLANYDEEPQLAQEAKFLRRFFRKNIVRLARFPNVLVVLVNHLTTPFKTGKNMFERPEPTTPGGRSPRYYSSVRLRFEDNNKGRDFLKSNTGTTVLKRERPKIFLWKNRVGAPWRSVVCPLNFVGDPSTLTRKGFDSALCSLEFLRDENVLVHPRRVREEDERVVTDTARWCLDGYPDAGNRYMDDWVRVYNSDPKIRAVVDDCVVLAARHKWTPEEWSDSELITAPEDLEDLADLDSASPVSV